MFLNYQSCVIFSSSLQWTGPSVPPSFSAVDGKGSCFENVAFCSEYWMLDRVQKPNMLSMMRNSGQNNFHNQGCVVTQYPTFPFIYLCCLAFWMWLLETQQMNF